MGLKQSTLVSAVGRQTTSNSTCQDCMHRHQAALPVPVVCEDRPLSSSERYLEIPRESSEHLQPRWSSPAVAERGSANRRRPPRTAHDKRWRTLREAPRGIDDHRRSSLEQIYEDLAELGLGSPKPIFGIDFTKSNEWTGKFTFNHRCLHHLRYDMNPHEQVISSIGRSLPFANKNPIPCYGFGDATTNDKHVFGFYNDGQSCRDIHQALSLYKEIVPVIKLAGPTSFAPLIQTALDKVKQSNGHYHALFIIADGQGGGNEVIDVSRDLFLQVTRSVNTRGNELSSQEEETIEAIVRASKYPLSIFLIGVGDGPWDFEREFQKRVLNRDFDNFKFINYTEIVSKRYPPIINEVDFDVLLWQTIYSHYRTILQLGLLRENSAGKLPKRFPVPYLMGETSSAPPIDQLCSICFENVKDMAFGCGHRTCCKCGERMVECLMCRVCIDTRIKLHL